MKTKLIIKVIGGAVGILLAVSVGYSDRTETIERLQRGPAVKRPYQKGACIVTFTPALSHAIRNEFTLNQLSIPVPSRSARKVFPSELLDLFKRYNVKAVEPFITLLHRDIVQKKGDVDAVYKAVKMKYPERTKRVKKEIKEKSKLEDIFILRLKKEVDMEKMIAAFSKSPYVIHVEPNYILSGKSTTIPNDTFYTTAGSWGQAYDDLWGIKKLECEAVWSRTQGEGVVVAVIDTGVDYFHKDLAENIWINPGEDINQNGIVDVKDFDGLDNDKNGLIDDIRGYDFYYQDNDPMDENGHGTHCAGTIAAIGNNGLGVIGVAPKATLMAVKGSSDSNSGHAYSHANAAYYAVKNGADVLNCSFSLHSPHLVAVFDHAYSNGVVCVVAAGNENADISWVGYQARALDHVITVGATNALDQKWVYAYGGSNYGSKVDVAAPGCEILSTMPVDAVLPNMLPLNVVSPGYVRATGTSMAAPHVAGLAALLISVLEPADYEGNLADVVRGFIKASAAPIPQEPMFPMGTGIANARNAFNLEKRPYFRLLNIQVVEKSGDGDQIPESGETAGIIVEFENIGPLPAVSLIAKYDITGEGIAPVYGGLTDFGSVGLDEVAHNTIDSWAVEIGTLDAMLPVDVFQAQCLVKIIFETNDGKPYEQDFSFSVPIAMKQVTRYPAFVTDLWRMDLSDNKIVWTDTRDGFKNIYLYDIESNKEYQITDYDSNIMEDQQRDPTVSGNVVVWEGFRSDAGGDAEIYLYDLSSAVEKPLTSDTFSQANPSVHDHIVAWDDARHGNRDIYMYDLSTGKEKRVDIDEVAREENPSVGNNTIAWDSRVIGDSARDVSYYDISKNSYYQITADDFVNSHPDISGDIIVWHYSPYGDSDVKLYDKKYPKKFRHIARGLGNQRYPRIHQNIVVWQDDRNGNWDIYMHDLNTGEERQITSSSSDQMLPVVYGNRVVWYDANDQAIYLTELAGM